MAGILDPHEVHRRRVEAATDAALTRTRAELGEPATPEARAAFDRRVAELVAAWTEGWEGSGLPTSAPPLLRWWRRRRAPGT